jgi:cellulose 1,4-beta-cellobiosidase
MPATLAKTRSRAPYVLLPSLAILAACGGAEGPPPAAPQGTAPNGSAQAAAAPAPVAPADTGLPPPTAAADVKKAAQVTPPSAEGNPFAGAGFYIDPSYVAKVEGSAKAAPADASLLKKVEAFPTAVWLDSIKSTGTVGKTLDDAAAQEKKAGKPLVTVFAVYDLPDRDCSAAASSGELSGEAGQKRYQKEYIDKIAAQFKAHGKQRIVAIVEPDSLPNIATNMDKPKCAAAEQVYKHSIAYAIKTLAMPNVTLYLDAAHAGWLGWSGNRSKIAKIFSDVLAEAGGADKIRGFATNVSNYDALKDGDLAKLEPSDPATGELQYVQLLDESLTEAGITGKAFVIDTSRNGKSGLRTKSGSWCNIKGAGLGERPQANPAPLLDAYFWIKPPGDSDGGANPKKPGYDENCGGPKAPDSAPDAPHAGLWFHSYFVELAKNATPPL